MLPLLHYFLKSFIRNFSFDCKTIPQSLLPVFFIFSLIFVVLRSLGGEFRMAVNIRLKYGNIEQNLSKYIGNFEYVVVIQKSKKASILLAFLVAPSEGLEPSTP